MMKKLLFFLAICCVTSIASAQCTIPTEDPGFVNTGAISTTATSYNWPVSFISPSNDLGYIIYMDTQDRFDTSILGTTVSSLPSVNSVYSGSGAQAIYTNTQGDLNVGVTNLQPNTTYYFRQLVYRQCPGGEYTFANSYGVSIQTMTTCNFEESTISNLDFGNSSSSFIRINRIDSNITPTGYVIKMNTSNSFTPITNGSDVPTANNIYAGSGEQVVYAGNNSYPNLFVRELTAATEYHFMVYAYYDGCGAGRLFQQVGYLTRKATSGFSRTALTVEYTGATVAIAGGSNISLAASSTNSTGLEYRLVETTDHTSLVNNGGNYELKPGAAGTVLVDIIAQGDATYQTTTRRVSIDITKSNATLSLAQNLQYTVNDGTTRINLQNAVNTTSDGIISYSIIGDALGSTLTGANNYLLNVNNTPGVIQVQATQAASGYYNAPESITFPVLFHNGSNQTPILSFSDFEITSGESITLNAQGAPFGSSVSYSFQSNATGSSIVGSTFTAGSTAGTSVVRATSAATGSFNSATQDITVTVKNSQTITFNSLQEYTVGDADFSLTATASSGLGVTYVSSNTSVATVSGSTVTIVGAGSTTITASQAGDGTYAAATDVAQTLTVNQTFVIHEQTVTTSAPVFCSGQITVSLGSTQPNVLYILRDDADDTIVAGIPPFVGNGSPQSFNAETLSASKTYNVEARQFPSQTVTKILAQKPTAVVNTIATQQINLTSPSANTARISLASSQVGFDYYLRDNSNDKVLQGPVAGTGGPITFPDETSSVVKTYNVVAIQPGTEAGLRYQVQLDGVDDYMVSEVGSIGASTDPLTLDTWVYIPSSEDTDTGTSIISTTPNSAPTFCELNPFACQERGVPNKAIFLYVKISGGQMYVGSQLNDAAATEYNSTAVSYPKDQWIHVAATRSGSTAKLYINGTLATSVNQVEASGATIPAVLYGRNIEESGGTNSANVLAGWYSTTRVWKSELTQAQITTSMNSVSYLNVVTPQRYEFRFGLNPNTSLSQSNNFTLDALNTGIVGIYITDTPVDSNPIPKETRYQIRDLAMTSCNAAIGTITFDPNKTTQNITFNALSNRTYGDGVFDLSASSDSGLTTFTYTSSNTDVATVSGSTVTIVGVGTTTITVSQGGDATYLEATASQSLTIDQRAITVTTEDSAVPVGGTLATLTASITSGSLLTGQEIFIPIDPPNVNSAGNQTLSVSTTLSADTTFDPNALCGTGVCILNTAKDSNLTANYNITANNAGILIVPDPNTGVVWDGSEGTSWNDGANWSGNAVPSNVDITIPQTTNMPSVGAGVNGVVNDMIVQSSTLTIPDDSSVTVQGNLSNEGTITVSSQGSTSGVLLVEGDPSGTVTYVRGGFQGRDTGNSNNNTNLRWSVVSAPVSGQKIKDFVDDSTNDIAQNIAGTLWAIGYYDDSQAAGSKWVYYTSADLQAGGTHENTTFEIGRSYAIARNTAGSVTFTGTLEVSDLNKSVGADQWNAIGNPYTAFIPGTTTGGDTNNFISDNTGKFDPLTVGVYVWDNSQSRYVARSLADVTATSLTPGQGFFVRTTTGVSAMTFSQGRRSTQPGSGNTGFNRNGGIPNIQLKATSNDLTIDTNIKYFDHTTLGLDPGYDLQDFGDDNFDLYTQLLEGHQDINFTIQSLPLDDYENIVIPIGVKSDVGSTVSFSAEVLNFPAEIDVYIEDREQSIFTKLNVTDGKYEVSLSEPLDGIGRFYIRTTSSVLSTDGSLLLEGVNVFTTENNTLRITGVTEENATVKMYNILGAEVLKSSFEGTGSNDIPLPKLRTGIYIVHLETETGSLNKKIVIE